MTAGLEDRSVSCLLLRSVCRGLVNCWSLSDVNKTQGGDRTVAPSLHSACHSFLSVHVCFLTASTHFSVPTPQLPHLVSHYWNIWHIKSQNLLGSVSTPYPLHFLSLDTKEFALSSTTGILQVIFFSVS